MTRSRVIGITGLSGGGKTTVSGILSGLGAFTVVADKLAHRAVLRGNPPYDAIVAAFGPDILNADGEIDRRKLGGIVFGDAGKLKVLEGIIHPYVTEETRRLIAEAKATGAYPVFVIDAPLLIEAGMNADCDEVWLVTAPLDMETERICARDGISREAAFKRLSTRNEEELKKYADVLINNDGGLDKLKEEVLKYAGVYTKRT